MTVQVWMPPPPAGGGWGLTIWSEKVEGQGEDAWPLADQFGSVAYLAVFDGVGGGGAQRYPDPANPDRMVKGAYLASRQARLSLREGLREDVRGGSLGGGLEALSARLVQDLSALDDGSGPASRVQARRLKHAFPTTVALAAIGPGHDRDSGAGGRVLEVAWAGDSRVYILDPEHGLHQVTRDHLRLEADAYENLSLDSPMGRLVSAEDARLDHHVVELPAKAIVVVATDGCYGYLSSPMHMEELLLSALAEAMLSKQAWGVEILRRITEVTGDDASLALFVPDGDSPKHLVERFAVRWRLLRRLLGGPGPADRDVDRHIWRLYHHEYESTMAPAEADRADDIATEATG